MVDPQRITSPDGYHRMNAREALRSRDFENLQDQPWTVIGIRWLFNQGISSVLLILILYGIWSIVPTAIDQYITESRTARNEFREINEMTRKEFQQNVATLSESIHELREFLMERTTDARSSSKNGD